MQTENNQHIESYERAFDLQQVEQKIKDALDNMRNYDFFYSSQQSLQNLGYKEMFRKVYMRYNCRYCKRNNSRKRRWTTTLGTFSIKYYLKLIDDNFGIEYFGKTIHQQMKDPYLLIFNVYMYGMKCSICQQYGQAQIYDSQLQAMEINFCQIISNIINRKPRQIRRNKNPIRVPNLIHHQSNLCEACHEGKCIRWKSRTKSIKRKNNLENRRFLK